MNFRFHEPWTDPIWCERAKAVVSALTAGPLTSDQLSAAVCRALKTKSDSASMGAVSTAEDMNLVSFDPVTGLWSLAAPSRNVRPRPDGWAGYLGPTEIGAVVGRGGSLQCGAPPAPRRHFAFTVKRFKDGPY